MFGSRILGLDGMYHSTRKAPQGQIQVGNAHNCLTAEQGRYLQSLIDDQFGEAKTRINITPKIKLIEEKPCHKNS